MGVVATSARPGPRRCSRAAERCVPNFEVRLDVPAAFSAPDATENFSPSVRELIAVGDVVVGDCDLLSQLYHEGDLLGWGADIRFSAFLTIWAKPQVSHDFAILIHRFERVRPPTLVLSGTSVAQRTRLRTLLKPLLKPEFAALMSELDDPDEIIDALWGSQQPAGAGGGSCSVASAMDVANGRIHAAYERLKVPQRLRQAGYTPQFKLHDPLMLLLSREAFGSWNPNRVAAEITGYDIFRTYAQFSTVLTVLCVQRRRCGSSPQQMLPASTRPQLRRQANARLQEPAGGTEAVDRRASE